MEVIAILVGLVAAGLFANSWTEFKKIDLKPSDTPAERRRKDSQASLHASILTISICVVFFVFSLFLAKGCGR